MSGEMWVAAISAAATLLAGGSIGSVVTARSQKKLGIKKEDREAHDSVINRMQQVAETQFNMLIKPLQDEVGRLSSKVLELEIKYEATKHVYWIAIKHIRSLNHWIARHLPNVDSPPPSPPDELTKDL